MNTADIYKKIEKIRDLPTLPIIAMEVNRMLEDCNVSIESLSMTIEKDQAISSKILKLVNSAFFGVRSKVASIREAVVLLGFNSVRNVVISASLVKAFAGKKLPGNFKISDFWAHSVACAMASRFLAEKSGLHDPADCFVGGLLHDIGKIIICLYFKDAFMGILTRMDEDKTMSFVQAEKLELPVGHARIGGVLAKKWQLPVGLTDAINYHHVLSKTAVSPELVKVVHVADALVNRLMPPALNEGGGSPKPRNQKINSEAAEPMLEIIKNARDWFPELSHSIKDACELFMK